MNPDRASGVLLGLACGDALGRPVEFASGEEITATHGRLSEMVGQGTWNQPAGTITDDTEQALCIARSVAEREAFDPQDVADRFVAWYNTNPFDIGTMTRRALSRLESGEPWDQAGKAVWEASPEGQNAGNGSVMRCPPIAVAFAKTPEELVAASRDSSRITHADPRCTEGCAVLNLTIAGLLGDVDRPLRNALETLKPAVPDELDGVLRPLVRGATPELKTSGYVVHTLQTALHDGLTAESAEEAIVTAVNRGGDTDTIGAVAGAVAGARFGADALPERWLAAIDETAELRSLADGLAEVA